MSWLIGCENVCNRELLTQIFLLWCFLNVVKYIYVLNIHNPLYWQTNMKLYIVLENWHYYLSLQFWVTVYWFFGFFQKPPVNNIVLWQINCFFAILISFLPPSLVYSHHCPRAVASCKEGFSKKISSEALVCCITHILLAQHCEQTSLEGLIFCAPIIYSLLPAAAPVCLQNQESPYSTCMTRPYFSYNHLLSKAKLFWLRFTSLFLAQLTWKQLSFQNPKFQRQEYGNMYRYQ